jgi:putative intracellular protease/amidase
MGTWGHGNFDNDTAADYIDSFQEKPSESFLLDTLESAVAEDDYLDADVASEALVAAEIIAATQQKHAADFPSELLAAVSAIHLTNPESAKRLARKAVKAILKESELRDLKEDGEDYKNWRAFQRELLERLA